LEFPVSSTFLKVFQQLLTSSSPSCRHFYPSFYLSFNNLFQKAVPTQDVTSPANLPSFHILYSIPLPSDSGLLQPSPAPQFKTFQLFLIYFLQCPSLCTIESYAPNVAIHLFLPEILVWVQFAGEERLLLELYNIN